MHDKARKGCTTGHLLYSFILLRSESCLTTDVDVQEAGLSHGVQVAVVKPGTSQTCIASYPILNCLKFGGFWEVRGFTRLLLYLSLMPLNLFQYGTMNSTKLASTSDGAICAIAAYRGLGADFTSDSVV
eukprot:4494220-Amphidinium_carterae.1